MRLQQGRVIFRFFWVQIVVECLFWAIRESNIALWMLNLIQLWYFGFVC